MSDKTTKSTASSSKRAQVANACQACRASKVKCSGKHPVCTRCSARGIECLYDVSEEGMTKRQHLRHELTAQRRELEGALAVIDTLRSGTDQQATEMLARLRLGQSVERIYEHLRAASGEEQLESRDGDAVETDQTSYQTPQMSPITSRGPYPDFDQFQPADSNHLFTNDDFYRH